MNYKVFIQYLGCFFGIIMFVSSASHRRQCKTPTNLKARHKNLSRFRNKFIYTDKIVPLKTTPHPKLDITCPPSYLNSSAIRKRSTCPWYLKSTYNKSVYPPLQTEVVCCSKDCLGTDKNYQCATVYTTTVILKRTRKCFHGFYIYKPSKIKIPVACVCVRKIDRIGRNPKD
ncbi:interleukin 17-like protein [Octopus bimaculoides]|uniref:Interleukin 17-like protein n=1 Tax=Octopus bimaculoides TaxID=37653 RepID=A0A0L8HUA6_OCTBM|nr:interleukin 17-like protein [Octopus bimaculoides]|eukprot:XP_014769324.1 PREDICTED: interleukin 17-like protein [Octopus bimaculoides]